MLAFTDESHKIFLLASPSDYVKQKKKYALQFVKTALIYYVKKQCAPYLPTG